MFSYQQYTKKKKKNRAKSSVTLWPIDLHISKIKLYTSPIVLRVGRYSHFLPLHLLRSSRSPFCGDVSSFDLDISTNKNNIVPFIWKLLSHSLQLSFLLLPRHETVSSRVMSKPAHFFLIDTIKFF